MLSHSSAVNAMTLADDQSTSIAARDTVPTGGFTIKGMMVVIAITAALLAMPPLISVAILLPSALVAPFLARRLVARRQRKPAAYFFGAFAASINVFYAMSCFTPIYNAIVCLCAGWAIFAIAPSIALGSAWVSLSSSVDSVPRRSPALAWLVVLVVTFMPLMTLWTLWPIRLGFLAARPEMERLANQAVAGQRLGEPRSVGLFELAGSKFDRASGDVALFIDPDPAHPRGFLWKRTGPSASRAGCGMCGSNMNLYLGDGWWYLEDD
jgi:hypothetical protein